jgi:glycosyltransferase involved in cell wall biosynthesis
VPFVFTGTSLPDAPSLAEKIAAYGLGDQCRYLGYVTVEEMAGLYAAAKGLVFPSLFEGFGIPLVEAMAAGCPVLSSDAASLPEIGGDAVVYFSPDSPETIGEALAAFWLDDRRRHSLIAHGRERARLFSASRFARAHLEAFAAAERKFRKTRFLKQALRYSGAGRRTAALLSRYIRKS